MLAMLNIARHQMLAMSRHFNSRIRIQNLHTSSDFVLLLSAPNLGKSKITICQVTCQACDRELAKQMIVILLDRWSWFFELAAPDAHMICVHHRRYFIGAISLARCRQAEDEEHELTMNVIVIMRKKVIKICEKFLYDFVSACCSRNLTI